MLLLLLLQGEVLLHLLQELLLDLVRVLLGSKCPGSAALGLHLWYRLLLLLLLLAWLVVPPQLLLLHRRSGPLPHRPEKHMAVISGYPTDANQGKTVDKKHERAPEKAL